MESKVIKSWRSMNEVLTSPMTKEELESNSNRNGIISANLLIDFFDLVNEDIEWLNDEVSERITGSICGLVDISYKVIGKTSNNEIVVKVTGEVDFENI